MITATNYNKKFYKDYEELQSKYDKQSLENKHLLLRATLAEDEQAKD